MIGSWLSSALHSLGNVVAGDGNSPGTPETRSLGYDSASVANAAASLLSQKAGPNVQGELLLMGAAGIGLILLMAPKRRR